MSWHSVVNFLHESLFACLIHLEYSFLMSLLLECKKRYFIFAKNIHLQIITCLKHSISWHIGDSAFSNYFSNFTRSTYGLSFENRLIMELAIYFFTYPIFCLNKYQLKCLSMYGMKVQIRINYKWLHWITNNHPLKAVILDLYCTE